MHTIVVNDHAYDWLASRIDIIRKKQKRYPMSYDFEDIELFEHLEAALLESKHKRDERAPKEDAVKAKPKAPRAPSVPIADGCSDHPTYGAKRRPRTDCEPCWALYKKLNPMNYEQARRDFERKQKA